MKQKGQGSLEYLLILGAVLAIAAIVVYIILGYTTQGEQTFRQGCENAKKTCSYTKAANAYPVNHYSVCTLICKPCYELDAYLIKTEGKGTPDPWSDIRTLDDSELGTRYVNNSDYANFGSCLSASPFI